MENINVLIVGLYPSESCPVFSLEFAKSLKHCGYNVYAVLPVDVINKENWIDEFGNKHLVFLKLNKSNKIILKTIQKYLNIIRFILHRRKLFKKLKCVQFQYVFYTFFHRWNSLVRRTVYSDNHILFVHDPIPHSDEISKRRILQAKQISEMSKLIVLSKSFIDVCVHEYNFDKKNIYYMPHCLMHYGDNEIHTLYNNTNRINFLFFGRITTYKGLDILLQAFHFIEKQYSETHLWIVGNGNFQPYQELYNRLFNVHVINRYIDDHEIQDIFCMENTVCVLPYLDATQSGVISIAYEFGTVVIATDIGGLKEQLADGKVGFFCEANNVQSLVNTMMEIMNKPYLLKLESERMLHYAKELNWDYVVKQLLTSMV